MTHGYVRCDLTGSRVIHKGCINHMRHFRVLYSVSEVILALGDTAELANGVGISAVAVKHWRKKDRIPPQYEGRIKDLLASRRYAAAPGLFR